MALCTNFTQSVVYKITCGNCKKRYTCATTDEHKTTSHNNNVQRCSASDVVETVFFRIAELLCRIACK